MPPAGTRPRSTSPACLAAIACAEGLHVIQHPMALSPLRLQAIPRSLYPMPSVNILHLQRYIIRASQLIHSRTPQSGEDTVARHPKNNLQAGPESRLRLDFGTGFLAFGTLALGRPPSSSSGVLFLLVAAAAAFRTSTFKRVLVSETRALRQTPPARIPGSPNLFRA